MFVHYRHLGEYSVDTFMVSDSDKYVKMYLEFKIVHKSQSIVLGPVTFRIQRTRHKAIHNQENLWQLFYTMTCRMKYRLSEIELCLLL